MKVALVIASRGRAQTLAQVLRHWAEQSRRPDYRVLSVTADAYAEGVPPALFEKLLIGSPGSCRQRNLALEYLLAGDAETIIFADDDYVPSRHFVRGLVSLFSAQPDIAVATGEMIADGVSSGGISYDDAARLVGEHDGDAQEGADSLHISDTVGGYGCNMAIRWSRDRTIRFDERLPLYGWQEDIDYSRQYRHFGRIVKTRAFAGVHMGARSARSAGKPLGYSQVVNPVYLMRKGTMPAAFGLKIMLRNFAANLRGTLSGDKSVDRLGRLIGNWIGIGHILRGKAMPERVLDL